jgi:hypothetical protein
MMTESLDRVMTRPEVFIVDWDGIIQFIDKPWLVEIKRKPEIFEPYFDFSKLQFGTPSAMRNILGREEYNLDKWLMKDPNQKLPKEVFEEFMNIYTKDILFYENCTFLIAAQAMISFALQSFCKEIVFLTHVPYADGEDRRKNIMLARHFTSVSDKFKLVCLPSTTPKWKWILENRPNYTTVWDDRFDILNGIIDNTDSDNKTFMMPYLGYNKYFENDKEFLQKVERKGIVFATYKQGFLTDWR